MKKYPSIEQFRNIIKTIRTNHDYQGKDSDGNAIYQHLSDYPTLTFHGTVKLHGTNAAIVLYKDSHKEYQSRERVLSLEADNAGFMLAMSNIDTSDLFSDIVFNDYIAVYGEWCGGSIQKGVALTSLPKMFVVFGIKIDDVWSDPQDYFYSSELNNSNNFDINRTTINLLNNNRIYFIDQFPTYDIDINFNEPETIQNKLIELTIAVEEECPVASKLGVKGIGEGIVFTTIDYPELKFKSKGEKHSVSKVKVLNSVNEEELNSIKEFVDYAVTENRLEQGLSYLKENNLNLDQKATGAFLSWIFNDILKEEKDVIVKNQIDLKKANGVIASKARMWFFKHF